MKKLLFIFFLALSFQSFGQWTITGAKNRWANGIGFGNKDTSAYTNASDTNLLVLQYPGVLVYRHLLSDYWKILSYNSTGGNYKLISDSLFNSGYTRRDRAQWMIDSLGGLKLPISDTAAMLANRLKISDTASMLSTYDRRTAYDVRRYGSISAALTAIGSINATLLIPDIQSISSSITIPSNVALQFIKGGILDISSGQTVTINGGMSAGLFQTFTGTGTVTFDTGVVTHVYPQWWYTGSGSWHTAINKALTATSYKGIEVYLPAGTYNTDSTIVVQQDCIMTGQTGLRGGYGSGSIINYNGSGAAITVKDGYGLGTVKNITITGGTSSSEAIGVLVGRPYTLLDNIFIYDFKGVAGIKVTDSASTSGGYLSNIHNVKIYGNQLGLAVLGDLKYGIWLSSNTNNVTVSECSMLYVGTSNGAGLYINGGIGIGVYDNNVESGYSASFTIYGILLQGARNVNLTNPYFETNGKNLTINNSTGVIVDNIYINGTTISSNGIEVNTGSSNVTIRNGTISSVSGTGTDITLNGSPTNVQIYNVITDDATYTGTPLVNFKDSTYLGLNSRFYAKSFYSNSDSAILTASSSSVNHKGISLINNLGHISMAVESSTGGSVSIGSNPYSSISGSIANRPYHLISNNTVGATLDSLSNFGIGTKYPTEKLDVSGNINLSGHVNASDGYSSIKSSANILNSTATTIYTLPSTQTSEGVYYVYAHYNDDSGGMAFLQVLNDRTYARSINGSNGTVALSLSGKDIQVTQSYGSTVTIQWSILFQKLR